MTRLIALNKQTDVTGVVTAVSLLIWWLAGFVIAKGFWSTLACFFPFYAYYLVVEKLMSVYGLV